MSKRVGINIPVSEMFDACGKEGKRKDLVLNEYRLLNRENVHDIFRYKKFDDDFSNFFTCYNSGSSVIGTFKPSYDEFLLTIMYELGLDKNLYHKDNEELTEALNKKIKEFSSVNGESGLYNDFNPIFRRYMDGIKYMLELDKLGPEYKEIVVDGRNYYYSCAMAKDLYRFIKRQKDLYQRFVDHRGEYKDLIETKRYNKYVERNFDMDKVAIYLTHKHITLCEENINDKALLKKHYKVIKKYFDSEYDKSKYIVIDNKKIDYKDLYLRFYNIKKAINKVDANVEWILVPEGEKMKKEKDVIIREESYPQHILELMKIGEDKNKFYEEHPPLLKLSGTKRYRGYIANIYENGEVILDTLYNSDYPLTATGDAIYHMKAIYFETISGLDKTSLKKLAAVRKIVHAGRWMDRVEEIINQEGTKEDQDAVVALVKKYKQKKNK